MATPHHTPHHARFIRFNVQQAILVDILTVVLGLLGTAAGYVAPEGEQFVTNFAFYCLVGAVAYAVAETARGKMANQVIFPRTTGFCVFFFNWVRFFRQSACACFCAFVEDALCRASSSWRWQETRETCEKAVVSLL